jgi:hypothetical protein
MKNIFAHLLVSPYLNHADKTFNIRLISDYAERVDGKLHLKVHSYDSLESKYTQEIPFSVDADKSAEPFSILLSDLERDSGCKFNATKSCLITIENVPGRTDIPANFFFMNLRLADVENLKTPALKIESVVAKEKDLFEIKISTDAVALFVWLDIETTDFVGRFSDNAFHMTEAEKVVLYKTKTSNVNVEEVKKYLTVKSLKNIYEKATVPDSTKKPNSSNNNKVNLALLFLSFFLAIFLN